MPRPRRGTPCRTVSLRAATDNCQKRSRLCGLTSAHHPRPQTVSGRRPSGACASEAPAAFCLERGRSRSTPPASRVRDLCRRPSIWPIESECRTRAGRTKRPDAGIGARPCASARARHVHFRGRLRTFTIAASTAGQVGDVGFTKLKCSASGTTCTVIRSPAACARAG